MTTQLTGQLGESIAKTYLIQNNFQIIDTNYRSSRWGEIDIIAIEKDQLVFIEVKTRVGEQQTTAIESITPHKLQSLKRACLYFKIENSDSKLPDAYRIDVVTVEFADVLAEPELTHYKNVYNE